MINIKITLISYQNFMINSQNIKTRINTKIKIKNQQDQDYGYSLQV